MRAILGGAMAVALVLTAGLGGADDKKTEKIDAKKIVGKWEPKDKEKKFLIEFTKDGKTNFNAGGDFKAEGTYKLDGNKLTMKMKFGDNEQTMTRTITKLTETELVSKDEKDKEDVLVRVKAEK